MPLVYIVILNYKNWRDVIDCLESVFGLTYDNFKVIVIDNDSQNDSLNHLMQWIDERKNAPLSQDEKHHQPVAYDFFHIKEINRGLDISSFQKLLFIQNDSNKGFASGNNVILRHLLEKEAYIWLLNPDMTVAKDALSQLVDFAGAYPFKSIIGTVVKFYLNPEKVHFYGGGKINFSSATTSFIRNPEDIPKADYISGGSLFVHNSHFKILGLLPENYFLYWEETDWCYHAKKDGYKILTCATAICYDKISATIGKSYLADFYYTRNGLLFVSRYKKSMFYLAIFSAFLRLFKRLFMGRWKRAAGVFNGIKASLQLIANENK